MSLPLASPSATLAGVSLRPLAVGDLVAMEAMQRAALPDPFTPGELALELERSHARNLAAFDADGRLCGAVLGWLIVGELQIHQVVVASEARRAGIGRALVEAILARVVAEGARIATLEVRQSNEAARQLYARLGFATDGLRRRYSPDGEDAVLMSWLAPAQEDR